MSNSNKLSELEELFSVEVAYLRRILDEARRQNNQLADICSKQREQIEELKDRQKTDDGSRTAYGWRG